MRVQSAGRILFVYLLTFVCLTTRVDGRQDNDPDYYFLKDLKPEWKVYDNNKHFLVPYLASIDQNSSVIHFIIDGREDGNHQVSIEYPEQCGIFVQDKLIDYFKVRGRVVYPVDSLRRSFGTDTLVFSIILPEGIKQLHTTLLSSKRMGEADNPGDDFMKIRETRMFRFPEFTKISVIFIAILISFVYNTGHRQFIQYFNISRSFSRVSTDEFLIRTSSLNKTDLLFLIIMSVLMGFHLLMITYHRDVYRTFEGLRSVFRPFTSWFICALILFIWYMFRIFIINVFSSIFQIRDMRSIHMFEFIRVTNFFSLAAVIYTIFSFFVFRAGFDSYGNFLISGLVAFSLIRLVIITVKFLNSSTYRKLYLFAYLCISELIPLFIGIKYILKSSFFNNLII